MLDLQVQTQETKRMAPPLPKGKVNEYMEGISKYLAGYRGREGLTQNEMAQRLGLSLNRYREYEQNTTDNSKGIALDLLLKITELEGIPLAEFIAKLGEDSQKSSQVDTLETELLKEFRNVPLEDRRAFVKVLQQTPPASEALIPHMMRWLVKLNVLLGRLPYDQRLKFEREILEDFVALNKSAGVAEHDALVDRLRELIKHYFTNFDPTRK